MEGVTLNSTTRIQDDVQMDQLIVGTFLGNLEGII